jgi:hypothetical protein
MFSWWKRQFPCHSKDHLHTLSKSLAGLMRLQQEIYLLQLLSQQRYCDPRRLLAYEHQVYSQGGEDGVLMEIFRRIGVQQGTFVEIGVGDGLENNTAFLLAQGWTGYWLEGNPENVRKIRGGFHEPLAKGSLHLTELFVTREIVDGALRTAGVPAEVDLLSIDVDQNTYWIWKGLSQLRARVVVIEYNATWPSAVDWKVDYDPCAKFDGTFCFGASLKAFEILGREHGYNLVGCSLAGVNAFFVRNDLCGDHFLAPFSAENHFEPARYWLIPSRDAENRTVPVVNFPRSHRPFQAPGPAKKPS